MQHQHTLQNNGMSSLGQSLRQRIIYQNINKNTRKVMKIEKDTKIDWLDKFNTIMTCIVGYTLLMIAGTALIAIISAMAH